MNILWQENTIKTSEFKCDKCKQKLGIGKIAIVLKNGKGLRMCEECGKKISLKK